MGRKWPIIIAIFLGLLAVFLTHIYFRQREKKYFVEESPVLVAARHIPKRTLIDYDMLAFKKVPLKFIQPGALTAKELAVGKTTLTDIMPEEQILSSKLAAPGTGLTLAGKTPPGKRAVTIGLDVASSVGGMIKPGDHVDVMAIFSNPPVAITLFQDILVLAVGGQMVALRGAAGQQSKGSGPITLALSPQEVQIVTVAMERGKIRLILRPQMEKGPAIPVVDLSNLPPTIDLNTLLQYYLPQQIQLSIEVIRGGKKETTTVP